jgi:hypothetical protein
MLDPLICGLGGFALEPCMSQRTNCAVPRTLGKLTKGFFCVLALRDFHGTSGRLSTIDRFDRNGMPSRHIADIVKHARLTQSCLRVSSI